MRIEETFEVPQSLEQVWDFFHNQVERVVRLVPGVEDFVDQGDDKYDVTMTQKVGAVFATFKLKAELKDQDEYRFVEFVANGRTVRGATGTLQSSNRVEFVGVDGGGTSLHVTSDFLVGGMIGSMGHRVIGPKAKIVTQEFAQSIAKEMMQLGHSEGLQG